MSDIALLAGRPVAEVELHLSNACASLGVISPTDAVKKAKLSHEVPKDKDRSGTKTPNPIDAEVGVRIRSRRRTIGLSQGKLAEALGVTFQQVQKYEKGTNRVGASRLQNLANALRVPVEYFFYGNAKQTAGSETQTLLVAYHDLTVFLETVEGKELNAAFSKIKSSAVRKRVVVLVKAIASSFPMETLETK
ncbi:helix-turn-helix domain-containing protein [Agrobacterium tumefaciens]|uniref:helix-turn-helix domain-containing protein n=1 Tax=Agrobacterium tumefaciens TaxID=358 RepID=UPI003BAA4C20